MTSRRSGAGRALRAVAIVLPSVVVGLVVAATTFPHTSVLPWRPNMVDLHVYRLAGHALLHGGDPYHLPGALPFLYPPFAAWIAVPLALLPAAVVQIGWTVLNVAAVLAIMHRCGVTGWRLALGAPAVLYFVTPIQQTLAFGQVGIFLVALVVLDLVRPGQLLGRRPAAAPRPDPVLTGAMTGLATAIKLTPGLFIVYLWCIGRRRAAIVAAATFVLASGLSFLGRPGLSWHYWLGLAHGDTGLGNSIIYSMNQSVMGMLLRVFGLGAGVKLAALAASAVMAVLGVVAGVAWHRRGEPAFAILLVGVATLLASPVSWLHHFGWVVPLGLSLLVVRAPSWLRVLALAWVAWVVAAPFTRLPNGADVELTYTWGQNLLDAVTTVLGIALLLAALLAAVGGGRRAAPVRRTRRAAY